MIKGLFKLAIFLLLANALFRFTPPYWRHHQFESAVKDASFQWRELKDDAVIAQVLSHAAQHHVPIGREHIEIRRVQDHLYLDVAYDVPLELIPSRRRPWRFDVKVDAWVLRAFTAPR